MRTVKDIDKEISELEYSLEHPVGGLTEVYSRIVGYYRALHNWNKGKAEEHKHRVVFAAEVPEARATKEVAEELRIAPARYTYFYKPGCPNCPPVKALLSSFKIPGEDVDVETVDGINDALKYSIYATPTVIFFDVVGTEVYRATNTPDLSNIAETL